MKDIISMNEVDTQRENDGYGELLAGIRQEFDKSTKDGSTPLFTTNAGNLYDLLLDGIPEEARQHYNCNACRHFVNRYGGLVKIDEKTGKQTPVMWPEKAPDFFSEAVKKIRRKVSASTVTGVFITSERQLGTPMTGSWEHMAVKVPEPMVHRKRLKNAFQEAAEKAEDYGLLASAIGKYRTETVETAVNLLRTVGDDENYKMSGRTVIIGGGNVAIDAARVSLRCGADAVTMVCLEPRDGMPASAEEIAEAEEEGTAIRCGYGPKEFVTENGHVTTVVLKKCTGLYNPEGRFSPTYDENDTITLPCDNVVLSIGQCIEWGDLLDGEAVELGRGQGAVADPVTYQTAQPDVFVGGDVYTGPRFAIDAIAAGKQGAVSIHRFVQPNTSMTIGRNRREFFELDKGNLSIGEYDHTPRQQAAVDEHIDAHRSFRDAHLTLTETQVRAETARCLGCGASVVDPNKCIGCGVCTTKCEFDAIHLHRDLPQCSKMVKSEDKFKAILPYMAKREIKIRFAKKGK